MIGIRKDLIKTPGHRVAGSDFGKGQGTTKGNDATGNPSQEEDRRLARPAGRNGSRSENAHTYDQPDYDHSKIKPVKPLSWFHI